MANFQPEPNKPEKEHSLPDTFIDKREELYVQKTNITRARIIRDERILKDSVLEYLTTLDYICNRIKPKLRGKYLTKVEAVQAYALECLNDVGASDPIPPIVLDTLDECHRITTEAMINYGFDQITPTVLSI